MEHDLNALKQKWLTTRDFSDEQTYLTAHVASGSRSVFLDPDGTLPLWLGVVVRAETGVVYSAQCGGVSTEQRLIEGYFVPLGGAKFDVDRGDVELDPLSVVFHRDDNCQWTWRGADLPKDRLSALGLLVEEICYWGSAEGHDLRSKLQIDHSRISELAEAWIPVLTPNGPGVLLYKNCD